MARRPRSTVSPSRISATSTNSVITSAVKNSPMTRAAASAMVIESSIVILRAARFSAASLKIGYPPMSAAARPITLTEGNGSHTRNQTAAAATATRATRARSAASTPGPVGVSLTRCSFQVGLHHVDQLLGRVRLSGGRVAIGVDQVEADMALHHLGHEAVHRAPCCGDEPHGGAALRFRFEGTLHGLDLAADAADPVEQLGLVADEMSHGSPPRRGRHRL